MFNFNLKQYVEQNSELVVRRESRRYPGLYVLKYHRRVFYKGLWTPELREMRGLVVDGDWNVIVHPFTKVYNRGEQNTDFHLDTDVTVVEKVNGFMAAVTNTEQYGVIISTTGSLDSEYADMASEWLRGLDYDLGFTYLFEICDKRDPHIIKEIDGAYLIGARNLSTGEMVPEYTLDWMAFHLTTSGNATCGIMRPQWGVWKFRDVVEQVKDCEIEGYMVHDFEGNTLKIKSPYYLTKKLFARMSDKKFDNKWLDTKQMREILSEEYYPLLDHIRDNRDMFKRLDEQQRLKFIEEFIDEQ